MSVQTRFDDSRLLSGLDAIQRRLGQMRPALLDVGAAMLQSTQARFQSETAPDGTPWVALSPRYARWKAKRGLSNKKLQLRGYLFGSLAYQATDSSLVLGSAVKYARIHQLGGRVSIPGRTGSVRLRTDRKGELLRQTDDQGEAIGNGKLAVFAKKSHKQAALRVYLQGGYDVEIPARPYLGMSDQDYSTAAEIIGSYLIDG